MQILQARYVPNVKLGFVRYKEDKESLLLLLLLGCWTSKCFWAVTSDYSLIRAGLTGHQFSSSLHFCVEKWLMCFLPSLYVLLRVWHSQANETPYEFWRRWSYLTALLVQQLCKYRFLPETVISQLRALHQHKNIHAFLYGYFLSWFNFSNSLILGIHYKLYPAKKNM